MKKCQLTSIILLFVSNVMAQNTFPTSGNVGIGTTSPVVKLSVYGPTDNEAAISLQSSGNSRFYIQQGGAFLKLGGITPGGDGAINILNTGNVGIGAITPLGKLDINGATFISGGANLYIRASSSGPTDPGDIVFQHNNGTEYSRIYNSTGTGGGALHFSLGAAPSPKMSITSDGNVGIGTMAPAGKLDVNGATFINGGADLSMRASSSSLTDPGDVVFQHNDGTEYARVYVEVGGAALNFSMGATPSPKMSITSDGNVGIGTTVPGSYKLAVEGTIGARKVKVTQSNWADFVFEPEYPLPSFLS